MSDDPLGHLLDVLARFVVDMTAHLKQLEDAIVHGKPRQRLAAVAALARAQGMVEGLGDAIHHLRPKPAEPKA